VGSYGAYIFSRRRDIEALLQEMDAYLTSVSEAVQRTRKGRVWRLTTRVGPTFNVHVRETAEILGEIEDELLEADLLPDDAPYTVGVSSELAREIDLEAMQALAQPLTRLVDGVMLRISR
jgi:hypothetical protein